MKKKLLTLVLISLVFGSSIVAEGKILDFLDEHTKGIGFLIDQGKILAHNIYVLGVAKQGEELLYTELVELITMNPPVKENTLLKIFIKLVLPFYALSIIGMGFYLLFYSGSPEKRAKAKLILGKLVLGMAIISLSPKLLEFSLSLSKYATYHILDLIPIEIYIDLVKDFTSGFTELFMILGQLNQLIGFIFPYLWLWYVIWGAFLVIMLRYIAVILWISLFPLTVFFYSFEMTRDLGRNMMEQTIIWTLLQCFNACVITGVALSSITPEIQGLFVIPLFADFRIFVGASMIILAPLMATRLFRNFLPG
jgi:hypothetical protein